MQTWCEDMLNTRLIGKRAEDVAADYLKKKGYRIIKRNFSNRIGEIDIIAFEDGQLIFIEVKARKNCLYGLPMESVNFRKQKKVRRVAEAYMQQFGMPDSGCRFDVVSIMLNKHKEKIELIKNAF